MSKVLIDTNIYSDAMRGEKKAVKLLKTSNEVLMSPVVVGELITGFKQGAKEEDNKDQLKRFLAVPRTKVLSVTTETADYYSFILLELKKAGTPIPTNDIWIAASAMQHGAKLATRDKHFKKIKGLFLV